MFEGGDIIVTRDAPRITAVIAYRTPTSRSLNTTPPPAVRAATLREEQGAHDGLEGDAHFACFCDTAGIGRRISRRVLHRDTPRGPRAYTPAPHTLH